MMGPKPQAPLSEVYRGFAEKEEAFAAEATLTNVKELHERSALKWRQLSEQAHRPAGPRK